jgi:hypothetical protein
MKRPIRVYICSIWRSLLLSSSFLELSDFPCGDFRPGLPCCVRQILSMKILHTRALGGGYISSRWIVDGSFRDTRHLLRDDR